MIKENQKIFNRLLISIDFLILIVSFLLAYYIRFESGIIKFYMSLNKSSYIQLLLAIIPIYVTISFYTGLYTPKRTQRIIEEIWVIIKGNILGILSIMIILYLFKEFHYSRLMFMIFGIINTLLMVLNRIAIRAILRKMRKKGYNLKHALIVGFSTISTEFLKRVQNNPHWGYNIIGILDDYKKIGYKSKNIKVKGKIQALEKIINENHIDEVIICLPLKEYEKLEQIIYICERTGVKTRIIPDYIKYIPSKPYIEEIDGLPIIDIRHVPLDNLIYKFIKRSFDIIFSSIAIVITSPVLITVAILIQTTSQGPIIYKHERVGLNRTNFNMFKFRSMKIQKEEDEKDKWTTKDDPRKTKIGSFIRKTSIDELPQFFNVLRGDMSVVGPRPERPFFVEKFKEEIPKYMIKHQVRPGITGWAQVNGLRGDTSIKKRIEFDLYYIENWNLGIDFKIILMTVTKGFINKNAY